jgi:hypothetical protein
VSDGLYKVREGDQPRSIAARVYGDGSKYSMLLAANPHTNAGTQIIVPNVKGRTTEVEYDGESPQEIIRRLFPNQPIHMYLQRFYTWNGGEDAELMLGEMVFVPDR